jgi:hypothetical protein
MKTNERDVAIEQTAARPDYVSPEVRIMNEQEILSAFQITAAGSVSWWVM